MGVCVSFHVSEGRRACISVGILGFLKLSQITMHFWVFSRWPERDFNLQPRHSCYHNQ